MFPKKPCFMVIAFVLLVSVTVQADFWFGVDGPEQLQIDSLKITLRINDGFSQNEVLESVAWNLTMQTKP